MKEYINSYKDRKPNDTYNIIKNYFSGIGYNIIDEIWETRAGTWTSRHRLIDLDNHQIVSSNGKGMTQEFCLASGYAELYERFCMKAKYWINPICLNKVKRQNYLKHGYYLDKNERIIDMEYMRNHANINRSLKILENHNLNYEELYAQLNDNMIGIPYKTINGDIEYLDPALIIEFFSTTGMASGNNYKEAFNQGFSEILERYILKKFFTDIQNKYYALDLDKIQNEQLINKINNIKNDNHSIYVLDMSYNFNVPVLILLLINNNSGNIVFNISSFPDFDIALERLLTEVYQGNRTLLTKDNYYESWDFIGEKNWVMDCYGSSMSLSSIPENVIYRINEGYLPNQECFISTKGNNDTIFNYYKNYIINNNLNIYIHDYSKIPEIVSLHIYVDNLDIFAPSILLADDLTDLSFIKIFLKEYYNTLINILNSGEINLNQVKFLSNILDNCSEQEKETLSSFMGVDWGRPYDNSYQKTNSIMAIFINTDNDEFVNELRRIGQLGDTFYDYTYKLIAKYSTLYMFYIKNYSNTQITKIMNFLNLQITAKELELSKTKNYLFYKILLEPFYKIYYSSEYSKLLDIMFN